MGTVIRVKQLCKEYKTRQKQAGVVSSLTSFFKPDYVIKKAISDISFSIEQGEIVGFIGPNGAGKTTTLKILSGILCPTSGSVDVLGHTPWKRKPEYLKQIAMVMGNKLQLSWDLPAIDSFILLKNIYGLSDEYFNEKVKSLKELFEVDRILNQPVRQLSLGERMKCELIASLLHDPKIIFLDEPTLGLDAISQNNFRRMIKEQNRISGTTFIITSHYMQDIKELCNRVIIVNKGKKIFDDELTQLRKSHIRNKRVSIVFEQAVDEAEQQIKPILEHSELLKCTQYSVELNIPAEEVTEVISTLFRLLPIVDISIDEPDISDIICDVYKEGIES